MNLQSWIRLNPARWDGLDPQQKDIIRWVFEGRGSLMMVARAGCGKTFMLMKIIESVVEAHLGDVAAMAFNRPIAYELKDRLKELNYDWKLAQAGTVHSFGFKAWQKFAPNAIVDTKNQKLFNIIDHEAAIGGEIYVECRTAIEKLCKFAKMRAIGHLDRIEDEQAWFNIWENYDIDQDVSERQDPFPVIQAAQRVYKISLAMCREVIDFDDMILAPLYYKARFWPKKWILLDESQDTNDARRALALAMLDPRYGRLVFAGDDRQAIYRFAGADGDSMERLKRATNASVLPLTVTRRCPKVIVAEAQKIVPDFTAHPSAIEGEFRALNSFADLIKEPNLNHEAAILCRNTAPLITTAYTLLGNGIACQVEGRSGIGDGLIALARRWKVKTIDKLLNKLDDYLARQTAKFMSRGQEDKVARLTDQVECLKVIIDKCLLAKKTSVDDVVEDIRSMFGDTKDDEAPRVLTLASVHRSKGREWPRVYILGRSKFMPNPYARKEEELLQEENLIYVALTRSKGSLIDVPPPPEREKRK